MTIAIGMLCAEGVIIAADQATTFGDGSQSAQLKVASGFANNCSFAIAHSTSDGNAALTLQGNMIRALTSADPSGISEAEQIIVEQMSQWSLPWASPPEITMLIGFCGASEDFEERGPSLLFASPPNTILRRQYVDSSRGYDAIGSGSAVTSPLHKTFLWGMGSAHNTLSKIAYLMDKAKRGNMFCGGRTNAVLVRHTLGDPSWITPLDMEAAEGTAGNLDFYLSWNAACFFGQNDEGVGQLADGLANAIKDGKVLRNMRFRTLEGEEILDISVQAPSLPTEKPIG